MPARITVYCRRPLAKGWLARAIATPDYLTAAELAELDAAAMEAATTTLAIAGHDLTYAGAPRPIQLELVDDAADLRVHIHETREALADDPRGIGALLGATQAIVGFELGFQQAEGIGGVIAEEVARALAIETDGLVDFYGEEWRVVQDGVER